MLRSRPRIDLLRGVLFTVLGGVFVLTGIGDELDLWNLGFGLLLLLGGAYTAVSAYRELRRN
jgi:uncharacterized membrane protein HdeD (DUF308 family)